MLAFCGCALAAERTNSETPRAVDAFVRHLATRGIHLVKQEHDRWSVRPPNATYEVIVSIRAYPQTATAEEIRKELERINLAYMLNEPAQLAMSYPGARGEMPKGTRLDDVELARKLTQAFREYRPTDSAAR